MKSNSEIDNFFKQKLADPGDKTGYREEDWDALEKMMDKGKKRRIVYWMPILSGVAALFFLILGWWLFKPVKSDEQNTKQQITKTPRQNQQQSVDSVGKSNSTGIIPVTDATQQQAKNNNETGLKKGNYVTEFPQSNYMGKVDNLPVVVSNKHNAPEPIQKEQPTGNVNNVPIAQNITPAVDTTKAVLANNVEPLPEAAAKSDPDKGMAAKAVKSKTGGSIFGQPQYALTIMGAPDINGVKSFGQSKTGTNIGLLFSVSFKKLTVTTGVAYSVKPYNVAFADYDPGSYYFRTKPVSVLADCRMLDIPLNVDYQLFNKNKNMISIGTGLSSYIMLHESYSYQYADPMTRGPRNYTIAAPGKYFLGIVNLQATYKRQVNSKVGVSLQPYLKLPLGDVGASKVRLQSAGVALGVSWNINPLKKP
nr:hypothetical protein [uncultured Mucilaginibacter sp.]